MSTIVFFNGFIITGKVKDLLNYIEYLSKDYYTIQQLIEANLH
jgi:hypothetical protein